MNSWSSQSTGIESWSQKWLFLMLWSSTAYQTLCEYTQINQEKWRQKTWNEFWSCKVWQMKFACTSTCNLRQCRKVEKGVDVFLQSCAQRCSIQAALEVSNHCAWNLRSMKFHSEVQSCNETNICAKYLKWIFRLWNCKVTSEHEKSAFSHAQKQSEVLLHHLPKFKSKKFSSKFPSAFFTSESRSWLSTYEVENIGWFILKFNFLSVFSTKSPMLSEVAGPCRSSSWQKQEVSNEVPLPTEKAKCAKIHTATSSVQFYLLSGRSSSCALPSWSPIHRICPSILSVEAWDLTTQYWSCFTRSSSSWRLQSNSNCKYILPAAVRTK